MSAQKPPRLPGGAHRYGWFIAIVGVALIAYASLNTLRTHSVGSQGLKIGTKVPPFAAPLALGTIDGDVNVARKANQGSAGRRPACSVRGPQILNSCELAEGGPFVLAFLATRGTQCTRELDRLARVRARHPRVQVAAVSIRGDRDDLRALVRRHGWASRSPGTATASWPTSSASRSARSSPTRCPAAWCRPRASASSTTRGLDRALRRARARGARDDGAMTGADPALEEGWVDRELALEFPELRLVSWSPPAPGRRTPSVLRERLALLADRFHGARALTLRREPVPHAYRVFFRHVGLDPDAQRTPVEAAALDRLVRGGFASRGPLEDALLVAVVETGVPVWALDDARLDGPAGAARRPRRASGWGRASTRPTSCPGGSSSPTPPARWRCSSARSRRAAAPRATARACGSSPSRFPGCRHCTSRRPLFGCVEALSDARDAR